MVRVAFKRNGCGFAAGAAPANGERAVRPASLGARFYHEPINVSHGAETRSGTAASKSGQPVRRFGEHRAPGCLRCSPGGHAVINCNTRHGFPLLECPLASSHSTQTCAYKCAALRNGCAPALIIRCPFNPIAGRFSKRAPDFIKQKFFPLKTLIY